MPKLSNREVAMKKLEKVEAAISKVVQEAAGLRAFLEQINATPEIQPGVASKKRTDAKPTTTGRPRGRPSKK